MPSSAKSLLTAIREEMIRHEYRFDKKHPRIPLAVSPFGPDEILEAVESMVSMDVTMGEKVLEFEKAFASYVGVRNAVMVNSGSSANLIALSMLSDPSRRDHLKHGFEAVVPAVAWSTSVFPVANVGGVPFLTDVDQHTFNIDPTRTREAITKRTRVLVPIHVLGNPADMDAILRLAREKGLKVVEDSCEAHGAEIRGKKVGSYGDISTFSFFFSHHITTIEGGMVLTQDEGLAELARSLRAHGWTRELANRRELAEEFPGIDSRFLFAHAGYNLRPTEIQGAFGIHQIKKLERFIGIRRRNASFLGKQLDRFSDFIQLQEERNGTRHAWFGYPITVRDRAPFGAGDFKAHLEAKGIETRPIIAGNFAEQPVLAQFKHKIGGSLPNARRIMRHSFFIGNHHGLDDPALQYIVSCFEEFFNSRRLI